MKRHPTTQVSSIGHFAALLVAVFVLSPVAVHALTVCPTQCLTDRDLALDQCNSTYSECIAAANGDPDLEAACGAAYEQCIPAAHASYDSCIAACPPLPCADECYKEYDSLVAQIEQNYQICVISAAGDPETLQFCADQRAAALALAASQLQACLDACPPTATEPSSWGAVKGLFR